METIFEILRLSPVLVLATMIFNEMDVLLAAPIATVYASIVAHFVDKKRVSEIMDAIINNAKDMQIAFFILMMAYAMAEVFMATGVGAAIIKLALNVGLTGRTVAVVGVCVSAVLSIATGTSWGTFAACAPIFLWLNHIVGGSIPLTIGAIAGGACFGDNIGLISDTTIVSSSIQKVEVVKRIRHQGVWSVLVLLSGVIVFYVMGIILNLPITSGDAVEAINNIPNDVWAILAEKRESAVKLLNQVKTGVPIYMIVPLIFVLIAAFRGMPTMLCLLIGIVSAFLFGRVAGTVKDINSFLELISSGFVNAGSWVIIMMMWIAAFGGVMKMMNAFRPLSRVIIKVSRNVRQLMFCNGVLSILGNAALADEMAQIVTIGPIIRETVENNVEGDKEDMETLRLRNATFSDALGVFGSQLIPWHVYIGFYLGIAQAVYPIYKFEAIDIIKYNFLAIIAVVSILLFTLTGLDRMIPRFSLPQEPNVKLKK